MPDFRARSFLGVLVTASALAWGQDPSPSAEALDEVVVTASLREQSLQAIPASVTVLSHPVLRDAGQQHFADVMALVPNLHFAGGTSRPRYFQIRGIGEREQYEGAPNPSVGFLVDDIDFSGIGMPATLFDVQQVEVLRGPQGTRYGANALAGLIAVRTRDPSPNAAFDVEGSVADYETGSLGFAATGPAAGLDSAWRLSVQQYRSDGFRDDVYLNRDDTNGRDELTARFKWRWQPSAATQLDLTLLHADMDNGYDAWSLDNTWQSQADQPGEDSQVATGAAARLIAKAWGDRTLTAIGSYARSDSINSFDGDWGNPALWAPYVYSYFARSERDRATGSLELRLASPESVVGGMAWVIGMYGLSLREQGRDRSVGEQVAPGDPASAFILDDHLSSRYEATNVAVFGQLDGRPAERWRWSLGLRLEQRDAEYADEGLWNGPRTSALGAKDDMLGGQASLSFDVTASTSAYASISRGYKAGGFNLGAAPVGRSEFRPEYLWSLEGGTKWSGLDGRMFLDGAVFYQKRRDLQIRTGEQLVPSDPNSYVFFTDNASSGYNYGVESTLRWRLSDAVELGGSLGLLRTRYSGYRAGQDMIPDREQAHAPEYQWSINGTWRDPRGWMARLDLSATDDFYFDVPPNPARASAFRLAHVKVGYETANWSVYAWGRNVLDETYAIRGFLFANDPADPTSRLYIQRGDPRQVGMALTYSFR